MKFALHTRHFRKAADLLPGAEALAEHSSRLMKTVGWVSAGVGAVAIGLVVGREIRLRYKFSRRTPYDFYAHSGDERDMDFGLGI